MSTEIKPGQTVRRTGSSHRGVTQGNHYTVAWARNGSVKLEGLGDYTYDIEGFEAVDVTPLDPSKVKAGDTVTVEVIPLHGPRYSLGGEVYRVDTSGPLWVGPVSITAPDEDIVRVTLTAHQPAPEPEPEWKPGTLVSATIWAGAKSKDEKHDVRLVRASNEEFPWYDPQEDDFYKDDVLTDVRAVILGGDS